MSSPGVRNGFAHPMRNRLLPIKIPVFPGPSKLNFVELQNMPEPVCMKSTPPSFSPPFLSDAGNPLIHRRRVQDHSAGSTESASFKTALVSCVPDSRS